MCNLLTAVTPFNIYPKRLIENIEHALEIFTTIYGSWP